MDLDQRRAVSAPIAGPGPAAHGLAGQGLALEELVHDLSQELAVLRHLVAVLPPARPALAEPHLLAALLQQVDAVDAVVRSAVEPPHVEPVDVTGLATQVAAAVRPLHDGELLLLAEPTHPVDADPVLLRRALLNLVVNAVEASPGGSVSVAVSGDAGQVRVEVSDDGRGGEPSADRAGLGTWVVHAVVRDAGGTVERRARADRGRLVRVLLPCSGSGTRGPS